MKHNKRTNGKGQGGPERLPGLVWAIGRLGVGPSKRDREIEVMIQSWLDDKGYPCGKPTEDVQAAVGTLAGVVIANERGKLRAQIAENDIAGAVIGVIGPFIEQTARALAPGVMLLMHDIERGHPLLRDLEVNK